MSSSGPESDGKPAGVSNATIQSLSPRIAELRAAALMSLHARTALTNKTDMPEQPLPFSETSIDQQIHRPSSIIDTPGRYTEHLQGELIPVILKSSKKQQYLERQSREQSTDDGASFDTLLAQYQQHSEGLDTYNGEIDQQNYQQCLNLDSNVEYYQKSYDDRGYDIQHGHSHTIQQSTNPEYAFSTEFPHPDTLLPYGVSKWTPTNMHVIGEYSNNRNSVFHNDQPSASHMYHPSSYRQPYLNEHLLHCEPSQHPFSFNYQAHSSQWSQVPPPMLNSHTPFGGIIPATTSDMERHTVGDGRGAYEDGELADNESGHSVHSYVRPEEIDDNSQPQPIPQMPAIQCLLSDGELDPANDDSHVLLSDGELHEYGDSRHGNGDSGIVDHDAEDTVESIFQQDGRLDIEGIVRSRVNGILKLKDPKLLKGAAFRALVLLLKCLKQTDPASLCTAISGAPDLVLQELVVLSHEFGLAYLADTCTTIHTAPDLYKPPASHTLSLSSDTHIDTAVSKPSPYTSVSHPQHVAPFASVLTDVMDSLVSQANKESDNESADMDLRSSSSGENGCSSSDVDMDTSSDAEYEAPSDALPAPATPQQTPRSVEMKTPSARPRLQDMPSESLFYFSRSRAPSPPSAQPRTPRTASFIGRSTGTTDKGIQMFSNSIDLAPVFPLHSNRVPPASPLATRSRIDSAPSLTPQDVEYTVCRNETDPLVVFINTSDESGDSDLDYDGDMDDNSDTANNLDQSKHYMSEAARRREVSRLNAVCRRLARLDNRQLARPSSTSNLARLNTAPSTPGTVSRPTAAKQTKTPTEDALSKAKLTLLAQEQAIAEIRLKISRKQALMTLRKKLMEAKRVQQALGSTKSMATSVPITPTQIKADELTSGTSTTPCSPGGSKISEEPSGEIEWYG